MKMFIDVYNTALLVLGISKEDFKGFLKPLQVFWGGFGVRYNREFYKFSGRSLLWTTIVGHNKSKNYYMDDKCIPFVLLLKWKFIV